MTVVASNFERQRNELYETEAWATEALIKHFPVEGLTIWEPAAGNHKIADVLRENNARRVYTSDIETYERKHDALYDFLSFATHREPGIDTIITNPPYGKGNRDAVLFSKNALDRCEGMVALLLTAKFDSGKTRKSLFQDNPRFWAKIVLLDRIQWFAGAMTGTEDHAWYVWGPKGADYGAPRLLYGERERNKARGKG